MLSTSIIEKAEIKNIIEALSSAYNSYNQLEMMLDLELDTSLEEIASRELDIKTVIYRLVKEFERRQELPKLIKAAHEDIPNNEKLKNIYQKISSDSLDKLKIILISISFDVLKQICEKTIQQFTPDTNQDLAHADNLNYLLKILVKKYLFRKDKIPTILEFTQRLCDYESLKIDDFSKDAIKHWLKEVTQDTDFTLPIEYQKPEIVINEINKRIDSYLFIIVKENEEGELFSLSAELIPNYQESNSQNKPITIELKEGALNTCQLNKLTKCISQYIAVARKKLILEYQYINHNLILELFIPYQHLKESIDLQEIAASGNQFKPLGYEFFLAIRCSSRYELDYFSNYGEFIVNLEKKWQIFQKIIQENSDERVKQHFVSIGSFEKIFNWDAMVDNWGKKEKICVNIAGILPKDGTEQNFFLYLLKGGIPISLWNRSPNIPFNKVKAEFNQILNFASLKDLFQLYKNIHQIRRDAYNSREKEVTFLTSIGFLCEHPFRLPSDLDYHLARDRLE